MKINLLSWVSEGLRSPNVEVNLVNKAGQHARVALIQMPNGTGKTTTLQMIRATLTGEAQNWKPEKIREFRRVGEENISGKFRVNLIVDERPLTIELSLDFENGTASYQTTTPGSGGLKPRYDPPPSMLKFLTPAFLDLFIFDGEFADELLDKKAGRADDAIAALCQLDLLDEIRRTSEHEWKARTSQGGPKTATGLSKLNAEHDYLSTRKSDLVKARKKAARVVAEGQMKAVKLKLKIDERIDSVESDRSEHAEAQLARQTADAKVSKASGTVMMLTRMPLALHPRFSQSLIELKDNLDKLKLPENTSAQFFDDLIEEDECICGREMNDVARDEIKIRAKGYLDFDEAGEINALKHGIEKFVSATGEESRHVASSKALDELSSARRDQKRANQKFNALAKKLVEAGDHELKAWQDEKKAIDRQIRECEAVIQDIDDPDEQDETRSVNSLKLVEKKLKEVVRKISDLTKTVALREKTELLHSILENASAKARETIRDELVVASNDRLEKILSNDPIRIERIDNSIHLANQSGASVGQQLSVGYTFLMSALSRGQNDFPLIVDSPANPIDRGVRRKIGKLIPKLCTQFIAFTINTERPGFVDALQQETDDCLFLTMFRRTEGTRRFENDLPSNGVIQTDSAMLINDQDYFMSFDLTDEEDV